ncbi:MAG: shikimate dehydrogenase [Deltaproteobacteria bacterium]|nr:MAG: shikimate dehydrogenase [Deltaproteobacteria bacterium]
MPPITGHTQVFALLGSPVAHSQSPAMHNRWFAELGLDAVYVALEVPPGTPLAPLLGSLAGANLTIPHKLAVVPLLDEAGDDVVATGAANAVVRRDGRLIGRNTDVEGFGRGVDELALSLEGGTAIVLGAGGAGRAVVLALARRGVACIYWLNRSPSRVEEAIAELDLDVELIPGDFAAYERVAGEATLVVNATSGPAATAVEALDVRLLPKSAGWVDLNYWMAEPPNLAAAEARGLRTQRGDRMLWHQGALAFELFTGQSPTR